MYGDIASDSDFEERYPSWMEEELYASQADPFDDDLYWINQREADDYRNEDGYDDPDWDDDPQWFLDGDDAP